MSAAKGCASGCVSYLVVPSVFAVVTGCVGASAIPLVGAFGTLLALGVPFVAGLLGLATGGVAVALARRRSTWHEASFGRWITGAALVVCAPVFAALGGAGVAWVTGATVAYLVATALVFAGLQLGGGLVLAIFAPHATIDWLELVASLLEGLS